MKRFFASLAVLISVTANAADFKTNLEKLNEADSKRFTAFKSAISACKGLKDNVDAMFDCLESAKTQSDINNTLITVIRDLVLDAEGKSNSIQK